MKKPYVAIVDDDSAFAAYLRTFLSLRGYEARCYTRGDELLASMKQNEPPDVVLLDVMMPGLDGIATLRALKASRPEAQVIMLSGRNQASTIVEAVRLGAADYVVKPDDPEGLGEIALDVAIKNAIEKNRLVSELSELRQQLSDDEDRAVWGNSEKMRAIATVIEQVADSDVTVLIRGESGVGKELVVARDSSAIDPAQPAVRQGQLRGASGRAARERALRARTRRLYRRRDDANRQVRAGRHRHADARRNRRDEAGAAGQAAPRAAGRRVHQARQQQADPGRRPHRRGHQPRSRTDDAQRRVPRGPLLPAEGHRAHRARRCASGRDEIPTLTDFFVARYSRKYNRPLRPISDELRQLFHAVRLAGEHPRAGEHDQARGHPSGRAARRSARSSGTSSGRRPMPVAVARRRRWRSPAVCRQRRRRSAVPSIRFDVRRRTDDVTAGRASRRAADEGQVARWPRSRKPRR